MTVAINNSSRPETTMDKIVKGLTAAKYAFGIPVDIMSFNQLLKQNDILTHKQAYEQSQADPNSPESKAAQLETGLGLEANAKVANSDPQKVSQLKSLIFGADGQPGLSAAALKSSPELSPLSKFAASKMAADASANRMQPFADRNAVQISKDYEKSMEPFRKQQQDIAQIESTLSTKDKNGNPLITSQQIGDANLAIARVFSPGHMSDATVARTEYESIPAKFAAALQKLSTDPTDAGSRSLVEHIIDQAHHIGNVANQNALKELDSLDAGYQTMQNPAAIAMANSKSKAFRERFGMNYSERGQGVANGGSPFGTSAQAGTQISGPKVGDVEDGHRYKGGNPADPNSWEEVK